MSKVIFFSYPRDEHFYPTIGLVSKLVQEGEEVIYCSTLQYKQMMLELGAQFIDYGIEEYLEAGDDIPVLRGLEYQISLIAGLMEMKGRILRNISERIIREQPDYIIYDDLALWGKELAKELEIPDLSVKTTVAINFEDAARNSGRYSEIDLNMPDLDHKQTMRAIQMLVKYLEKKYKWIYLLESALTKIILTSEYFQTNQDCYDQSYHFIGPSIYEEPADYVCSMETLPYKKSIFIAFDSFIRADTAFYRTCFEAFENSKINVFMAIGDKRRMGDLGRIPDNFLVREHFSRLNTLQKCALFITHGGINATNDSLYLGVPMFIIPFYSEQLINAARVEQLKAGLCLDKEIGVITANELKEHVEYILQNERFQKNAGKISKSFQDSGGSCKFYDIVFKFKEENRIQ